MKVCFNAPFVESQQFSSLSFQLTDVFFVEYKEDTQLVPKNSSVIVKLVPLVQIPVVQPTTQPVQATKPAVTTATQSKPTISKVEMVQTILIF